MSYRLTATDSVLRLTDGATIPADPGNVDYLAYLDWLAEGNTPAPAEPLPGASPAADWGGFLDAMVATPLYQKVLVQSIASPEVNVHFTGLMGALVLAAAGRPNLGALQSGLAVLLGAMVLEPADLAELQDLVAEANLPLMLPTPT